jgi:PPIC-type PPIASE domain
MFRRVAARSAVVPASVAIAACGGSAGASHSSQIVARVGGVPVAQTALAHWMRAMAAQHIAPDERRQRALDFLIASQWLIGEATAEGVGVSNGQVAMRLTAKERSFPNGRHEFEEFLRVVAHTVADQELEIRVELASEAIRRRLVAQETKITPADVARYHRQHLTDFIVPEERYFYIVENIPSAAAAKTLMAEVRAGRSLPSLSLKESYPRKSYSSYIGEKRTIIEAIFKATPHVLTGPIRLGTLYFLIEVTRATHPYTQSFAQVRGAISSQLAAERQRRTLATFTASWHNRWKARTDCHGGYVVQRCRQYTGPESPEEQALTNPLAVQP